MAEISNPVAFGDIVRIKQNPETIQAAARIGAVVKAVATVHATL